MEAYLTGVYPRSEKLVAATRAAVRGSLAQTEVDRALEEDLRIVTDIQKQADLDSYVDGQLNWQDLFRPFSEIFTGIEPSGLSRWFDNNTFYRKPIIKDRVSFKGEATKQYFRAGLLPGNGRKRAILPGPFTFATLSENRAYTSFSDLTDDLAHALEGLVRELRSLGYDQFQFDEPSLSTPGRGKADLEIAKRAFGTCANGRGLIHTYFGDAGAIIDSLLDFPVESVGVDFYSTPESSLRKYKFDKALACGCIDGRNSLIESPVDLRETLLRIREDLEPAGISLIPNCSFEFLPASVAERKVATLGEAKRLVNGK